MKTIIITLLFTVTSLTFAATVPERFYDIDEEFYQMVMNTTKCVLSIKSTNRKATELEECELALKIKKDDIKRLQTRFNKQVERYKVRKQKLSKHSQYWVEQYMLKIRERALHLQKNIHTIYDR